MDAAKQLRNDAIPFAPRGPGAGPATPLQPAANPFVAGGSVTRMGRPMQTAFGEIVRQIALQTPVVVVAGNSGTGKSLLMDLTARAAAEMGLSVRRVERGDQVQTPPAAKTDILLVDQADSIPAPVLQTLLAPDNRHGATTMVFMCHPSGAGRFSAQDRHVAAVELTPLSQADARTYLMERATSIGRPNLFTPEALNLVIDGSRGLLRLLRSIAHLAYVAAAGEGASQIGAHHVVTAAEPPAPVARAVSSAPPAPPQFDSAPAARPRPAPEPQAPPVKYEPPKRAAERPAAQSAAVSAKPAERAPRVQEPIKLEKNLSRPQSRPAEAWAPRAVGIAGTLLATVAIGAIVSWMVSSQPKVDPRAALAPPPVARPAAIPKSEPQVQAPATQTAAKAPPQIQAPAQKSNPVASPVVTQAAPHTQAPAQAPAQTKTEPVAPAPVAAAPVPAQPARENPAPQPAPVEKAANEPAAAPAEPAPPVAVTPSAPTAIDIAAQEAAQRAAEQKAAEEKAVAERAKAAEQARLAQEAKDRAEKAAAALAQAAKDAAAQDARARQRTNQRFNNSFLGVGR